MENVLNAKIDCLLDNVRKRKNCHMTNIDGIKEKRALGKVVYQQASEYPEKVFILQEVESQHAKEKELKLFRIGYYIIGKKPKMRGKWVWGQYAPFITTIPSPLIYQ
jgi:hypothetical protein